MSETKPNKKTLKQALLENFARDPALRLSSQQMADHLGVEVESVREATSRLRKVGALPASERQVTGAITLPLPNGASPARGADPEALLGVLQSGGILDAASRMRLASHLATTAPSPVAVQAIKLLATELDPQAASTVGPPDPLTDAERVDRLARLLVACGRDVHRRALELAERRWDPVAAEAAAVAAQEPTEARD